MVEKLIAAVILLISVTGVMGEGRYCTDYSSEWWESADTMWCEHGCCGGGTDVYCCLDAKTGMLIGIVVGSIALVAIIATVLVIIFCCCRKSRGRAGQVYQPPATQMGTTVPMQTVGYGQMGYTGAVNQTVVTSNMTPGTVQTWHQPPPTYDQLSPNKA